MIGDTELTIVLVLLATLAGVIVGAAGLALALALQVVRRGSRK